MFSQLAERSARNESGDLFEFYPVVSAEALMNALSQESSERAWEHRRLLSDRRGRLIKRRGEAGPATFSKISRRYEQSSSRERSFHNDANESRTYPAIFRNFITAVRTVYLRLPPPGPAKLERRPNVRRRRNDANDSFGRL